MTEARMKMNGRELSYTAEEDTRIPVDSWDEVPHFLTEDLERAWWETHTFSERFWLEAAREERERRARGEEANPPRPADVLARARQQTQS